MKNLLLFLLPALLLATVWQSCWKDDAPPYFEPTAEVAFAGRVTDESGQPVAEAAVRAGAAFAKTDANGVFRLKAVRLAAADAKLSVFKIGYFEFTRSYVVKDGAVKIVDVQLLTRNEAGSVSADQGGEVTVPGGVSLKFPAGAVAKSNGGAYSGTVRVYAHYIDPTSPDWYRQMPGDLRAINLNGAEQGLTTFGMVAVELADPGGNPLQVASGHTVQIRMPIQPDQASAAPETIPLWWFDTERSRWIEEGIAQKSGNEYVGQVSHFTWWNCDFPGERVQVSGQVFLGDEQHPLGGVEVWICPQNVNLGWGCGHGDTDAEGHFAGGAPLGVPLELSVVIWGSSTNCSGAVYTQLIGPLTDDVALPPIIIPDGQVQSFEVSGKLLNCLQQPVASGYARIECGNAVGYAYTDANGNYSYTFPCVIAPANVTVKGYDLDLLFETQPETVANATSPLVVNDLEACDNLAEFFQYNLDGQDFFSADPQGYYQAPQTFIYGDIPFYYNIQFSNNAQTGTFQVPYYSFGQDSIGVTTNINTTVTEFGNVGQPIIGTFGGTYTDFGGATHTVSGSYRVLRDQ